MPAFKESHRLGVCLNGRFAQRRLVQGMPGVAETGH